MPTAINPDLPKATAQFRVDREIFDAIKTLAITNGVTFSVAARMALALGLAELTQPNTKITL